jgi:hypothetical protein
MFGFDNLPVAKTGEFPGFVNPMERLPEPDDDDDLVHVRSDEESPRRGRRPGNRPSR